jgi:MFS family permease
MRKATTERGDHTVTAMDRVGAFSGATFFVLANIAIAVGSDPEMPDEPTGQESLDGLSRLADNPLAQAATSLEFVAFVAWMVFVGYVAWRIRAAGWLAAAVLVGGITQIAVKLGSAAPLMTSYVLRDQISPEQALVITQMNLAAFKVGVLPAGLFVLAAAIAALRTHALGRILAWAGIVIGVATIVVAMVTGLNIGRAGFSPIYLLVLLWEFAISMVWGFARGRPKIPAAMTAKDQVTPF